MTPTVKIINGDSLTELCKLPDQSVHCCVTSPPYWGLRDYQVAGQLGLEKTPEEHVAKLVEIYREVRRVLRDDGTVWLNIGDSYAGGGGSSGHTKDTKNMGRNTSSYGSVPTAGRTPSNLKPKDLVGIPWRVAFALQADGWWLRQDIIWSKPSCVPESVTDRCTKSHEYIFLMAKSKKYYYDHEAIKERGTPDTTIRDRDNTKLNNTPGKARMGGLTKNNYTTRNKRSVWTVSTRPFKGSHFAVFPPDLIKPCILAGCPPGGTVLDPFGGSGTTGMVALELGRNAILIELNQDYIKMIEKRTNITPGFGF